jgi:hypothetical protein
MYKSVHNYVQLNVTIGIMLNELCKYMHNSV